MAKWLPAAEQVTLESCGHLPQVERPEETNALLTSFFARVEAEQPARTGVAGPIAVPSPDARDQAAAA